MHHKASSEVKLQVTNKHVTLTMTSNTVTIILKNPHGQDITAVVPLTSDIANLKRIVTNEHADRPEPHRQKIIFSGRILQDRDVLANVFRAEHVSYCYSTYSCSMIYHNLKNFTWLSNRSNSNLRNRTFSNNNFISNQAIIHTVSRLWLVILQVHHHNTAHIHLMALHPLKIGTDTQGNGTNSFTHNNPFRKSPFKEYAPNES